MYSCLRSTLPKWSHLLTGSSMPLCSWLDRRSMWWRYAYYISMLLLNFTSINFNSLPIAVCQPPCSNGGNCTQPGYCSCPSEWEGARCETRKLVAVSTSSFIPFYSSYVQLDVHQNARMVEIAMSLETVTAPLGGQEIDVKKVLKHKWIAMVCIWSFSFLLFLAQCRPPCANGGHCFIPGHCVCPSNWTGPRCEEGTNWH